MQTLPPPVDQLVGKTLGHYDVEQLLGYGNINAVYAAQQQPQQRTVMLTAFTLPETFSLQARERFMTRFTQNASLLLRLNHPHILPTYDSGEQFGYPYLVTPFVTGGSLAKVLRQEKHCTPEYVLQVVKQIAEGLDYAHQNGMVHGMLKPANILLDDEQGVQIAGFGLINILKMQGIETINHPYKHLVSIASTFLGSPEYIAPEVVQGALPDQRSDVYALGIMMFELLTGKPPFMGNDPFTTAMQHVQQAVPPLQSLYGEVPPGLDLVVQRAIERNPAQRIQSAGKLANAFERVLSLIQRAPQPPRVTQEASSPAPEMTLPPTVNWFDEEKIIDTASGPMPAMPATLNTPPTSGNWQLRPPIVTNQMAAVKANTGKTAALAQYANIAAMPEVPVQRKEQNAVDPFVLWTGGMPAAPKVNTRADTPEAAGTFIPDKVDEKARTKAERADKKAQLQAEKMAKKVRDKSSQPDGQPAQRSRRRAIAMIATSSVVAAGVIGAGGIGLAHFLNKGQTTMTAAPTTPKTSTLPTQAPQHPKQPTTKKQTAPAAKKQTAPPAKQTHTGTVVGQTTQGKNSAQAFKNPADNKGSLLVHLPNGNFVAYESACTHQQVTVNYDLASHTFICPLHGSVFDPAQNGKVLQGPAVQPLPAVTIHVNGDGTVTTG